MIEQLKTIRAGLETATCYSMLGVDAHAVQTAITALTQLEAMVGEKKPVAWSSMGQVRFEPPTCDHETYTPLYAAPVAQQPRQHVGDSRFESWYSEDFDPKSKGTKQQMREAYEAGMNDKVAQQPQAEPDAYCITTPDGDCISTDPRCMHQPQEIEVQCPVCNHKFYEWPNDKQPQAEAVPVVDRVYEAAKRLVDHADFQLGGVLSAKSKARDIPSNAASKVKARHLASLRDALAKAPQQAEAVPPGFEVWLRTVCFQRPTPEAYDLAKAAWSAAIAQQKGQP